MAVLRIHAPVLGRQERVFEWNGRPISVGRDDTCDVVLLEQAASRHHARLERDGDEIRVIDCDSANGVWVGDERVVGSRALRDGEVVRIGDTTLELVLDPHHQPTLYRTPAEPQQAAASSETVAREEAATLEAAPSEAAPAEAAPAEAAAPDPPALVIPHRPAPVPAASSPSAYSLGTGPTLAGQSGPALLGVHEPSHPSTYSLGTGPTLAGQSGPALLGVHEPSAPSVYSIGEAPTLAPHVEPSARPIASSASVYSLGHEPAAAREPEAFGPLSTSSASVYSLGHEPAGFVPRRSSGSDYSLGDAPMGDFRGPDVLPPAPSLEGAASSAGLGAAPPRPAAVPPAPAPLPPAPLEPRPPAFVTPAPARSAGSSWGEWSEPMPAQSHRHGRAAGPTLWLGLGLFIGGILAMVIAVAAGYDPSELASSIAAGLGGNGGVQ